MVRFISPIDKQHKLPFCLLTTKTAIWEIKTEWTMYIETNNETIQEFYPSALSRTNNVNLPGTNLGRMTGIEGCGIKGTRNYL